MEPGLPLRTLGLCVWVDGLCVRRLVPLLVPFRRRPPLWSVYIAGFKSFIKRTLFLYIFYVPNTVRTEGV